MCIEPCGGRPVMEEEKPDEECNDPLGCKPDEGRFLKSFSSAILLSGARCAIVGASAYFSAVAAQR